MAKTPADMIKEVRPMTEHSNVLKPTAPPAVPEPPKQKDGILPPAGKNAPKHIAGEGFGRIAGLVLVLLLGAASLHAQYALSVGGLLGTSTWDVSSGGAWVSSGSTVAGGEVNLAYGSTDATGTFQPLFVVIGGIGGENKDGANYANALLGGGAVIPNTTVPLVLAADWRVFSGKAYPGAMLGATFTFGKPIWVSK